MIESLTLPIAVFGPLASGADMRLLATPAGVELPRGVIDRMTDLHYAGWRASAACDGPYVSLIELDAGTWGLARCQVLARRALGAVYVSWFALLTVADLEAIGWQTQRLWSSHFPDPLTLPSPSTRLEQVSAPLGAGFPEGFEEAEVDKFAYAVSRHWSAGEKPLLPVKDDAPRTAETALAAVLARLGGMAQGRTYTTWPELELTGYAPGEGGFDLVVGTHAAPGHSPLDSTAAPGFVWLDDRWRDHGIAPAAFPPISDADLEGIAAALFVAHGARIMDRDFSLFETRATSNLAPALPTLLQRVVEASGERRFRAEAVDAFVMRAVPLMPEGGASTDPLNLVARVVETHRLILALAPETVGRLRAKLFGEAVGAFRDDVFAALDAEFDAAEQESWRSLTVVRDALVAAGLGNHRVTDRLLGALAATPSGGHEVAKLMADKMPFAAFAARVGRVRDDAERLAPGAFDRRHRAAWGKALVERLHHSANFDELIAVAGAMIAEVARPVHTDAALGRGA